MIYCLLIALSVCTLTTVNGIDRSRLTRKPAPQKNFMIEKYVGDWYLQARLTPCSWSGSNFFTDFITQFKLEDNRNVQLTDNFRSSYCVSLKYTMTPCETAGEYKLKDPVGDVVSGDCIIVATDYKTFSIEWGCTKHSIDGSCADSYVIVKTRKQNPSPQTWKIIESILDKLWALTLSEMQRTTHENGCIQLSEATTGPYRNLNRKY